ncbi:MAG: S-adenosylmethionine:tRNA ribosyltransferase-isomerase, partial [Opitutus sp.]
MPLASKLFDYALPPRLIAQTPAARRDHSRLLVVRRERRVLEHRVFADLPHYLRKGDILMRNNAAVLPARLHARRPTGGDVECFLLRAFDGENTWRCLLRPGRRLPAGAVFAD